MQKETVRIIELVWNQCDEETKQKLKDQYREFYEKMNIEIPWQRYLAHKFQLRVRLRQNSACVSRLPANR
jgi:hypothetical protein